MSTKKFLLSLLALALFGCAKQSDVENLQKQIDDLVSDQIASIETQIMSIRASIGSLETIDSELRGYITTLQEQKTALEQADQALGQSISELEQSLANKESALHGEITAAEANVLAQLQSYKTAIDGQISSINTTIGQLQSKDTDLQNQINNLKTYIDGQIQSTKDWASATFVTLEQYNTTAGIVAGLQTQITSINTQIQQLSTTIAGVTQEDLENAIGALDESLQAKISEAVGNCNTAISAAKNEITAAYTTAIRQAIASSESTMKNWVNNQLTGYYTISQTDAKLSALKTTLESQLASQKTYLEGLNSSLETTLTGKIETNSTLISNLQTQVGTLSGELSTLAATVATNGRKISQNSSDIATNARNIAANASDIDECERLIAANKRLIEANTEAIGENASAVIALQQRATTDEQNIATNASNIAQNASDIASNAALISANATAIANNAQAISNNAADIAQLRTDLATARSEITAAYQQAIATAISTLDGQLRGKIAMEVETLNSRIDSEVETINTAMSALEARVASCERDIRNIKNTIYGIQQGIEDIQDQIAAILARIQSITYVPAYSDGKAVMLYTDNGTLTPGTAVLDFKLQPASTATELVNVWQTALSVEAVYTITKAAPETVALTITDISAENGYLSLTISGAGLKEDFFRSRCSANAALIISDGNNELASEYVPLVPWTTDVISFGDAAFKAYCVENFDTSGDGEISEDEAKAVTAISASMLNINSLVGIEYFSNLESLDVSFNKLTSLNLSHSPKLKSIDVSGNKLQTLNIDGLTALETLDASNNKLTSLDVSESPSLVTLNCNNNQIGALNLLKNRVLKELQCNSNKIQTLNLKNNTLLETLYCRKNELSVLDVTKLTALKELDCSQNSLSSLNLYQNPDLEILYCASNQLTSLGITTNTKLIFLDCHGNAITALDVSSNSLLETLDCASNQLIRLDFSSNPALETVTCTGNPSLAKLWVKDVAQAAALSVTKDDFTTIAYNNGGINIPDPNLKAYLLARFDDDEDGEISILESENIQNVNCSGHSVSDLTGLECCPNLKYLNFNGNNVSTVELPNLRKLETIVAYGNPISRLNINNDTALTALYLQDVSTNALNGTEVTIKGYSQAETLYLAFAGTGYTALNLTESDMLTSYDISENVQLEKLVASFNPNVTTVNLTTLTALTHLNLRNCGLTSLNLDTNVNLSYLNCTSNSISSLNVDNNTKLSIFYCSYNNLSTLRLSNNTVLSTLYCSSNNLSNLNVRNNTALQSLNVSSNTSITALALGYNINLEYLYANDTGLTDIDLSDKLALQEIKLSGCSSLHEVNVSNCSSLSSIDVAAEVRLIVSTGLKSIYKVGQYVSIDGVDGIVFDSSSRKIFSIDEASKYWGYYGTYSGAISDDDGVANTNKIEADSPAAIWCRAKGAAWYLPAYNELHLILHNSATRKTINSTLSSIGAQQLTGDYWSSTESASNSKEAKTCSPNSFSVKEKIFYINVRAIRVI
jgi:Leucine-rich repeat (LRR) protein